MKALKDFKTVNQKFKAGDDLPDDLDFVKWADFVSKPADDPATPAAPAADATPFKF